jgi:hypothetical protein
MKWEVKREKKIENDNEMKSRERWAMLHRRFG